MSNTGFPAVLILGRDTCEDSIRSRAHLDAHGISYTYRNVEIDPDADVLNRSYNGGVRVTPTILIGDPDQPTRVIVEPTDAELDAAIDLG